MSDSPVGWGDKRLDGTGTGLERGGDPPEQDAAARQAAELLSCKCGAGYTWDGLEQHTKSCAYWCRPAVAAALRERDDTITRLLEGRAMREERIAALEAQLAEAAREIPCAGPIAHRIRILQKERQAQFTKLEADYSKANRLIGDYMAQLQLAEADNKRLRAAIAWALGEGDSDFAPREKGQGPYWWRKKLAALAGRKP